ncbi:DUF6323 family protein [Oceanobacillus neutriphilus]|uniref:Uncharacterized protein n=1 Tax=Oceanobacillus neutriphilus TaxID=531815 RepID=A0ABQ2P1J2_9BACI|nr:DUF6323 family protein [Oceanobacillus neutriphilus]GGP15919.1 hypothetical protein GCM10011346_45660 [Oceanobacillus neutriphilus]
MNLSDMLNSIQQSHHSNTIMDLVSLNEKTKERNLVLTPDDAKSLVVSRNKVLRDHARIELSNGVLKELIEVFSVSPYMNQEYYVDTLNELQEIFYYLKNETEDKVEDAKLIQLMNDYYNGSCAGSIELLRSKMEEFAENFRRDITLPDSIFKGDE